jgi:hypothetical protein
MEEVLESVFSMRSVPRIYTEKRLQLGQSLGSVVRQSLISEDVNTEDEEATTLKVVTRRQTVKTHHIQKI